MELVRDLKLKWIKTQELPTDTVVQLAKASVRLA